MPGFEALGPREMLPALLELETAAIAGQQALARRLATLDALRTVAMVMAAGRSTRWCCAICLDERTLTKGFENGR